jgi:hypothetical protein
MRAGSINAEVSGHNSREDRPWTGIWSGTKRNTEASPSIREHAWFRAVLRTKHLADIAVFPASPSDFYA